MGVSRRGYHGDLRAANHPDGGCVFTVDLPLASDAASAAIAGVGAT